MASSESMPELNAVSSQRSFKDRMLRSITNFPLGQFMPGGEKQADSNLSTQDDDAPPVKKGWLRKQGGVVKNWHSRYFVLRGHTLYYYMSNDESKLLGTIILAGNKVVEYPVSPAEPDKFPFEILPGGEKSRMTITHETYPLIASTEDDRRSWIIAIKKVMYADVGGAIFGQSLEETMAYENKTSNRKVPRIMEQCVEYLLEHGLDTEGIFRLPGRQLLVKQLRDEFDCGKNPPLSLSEVDVHSVASLLKLYLRDLPEPLICHNLYDTVVRVCTRDVSVDPDVAVDSLTSLLTNLPRHNYNALQYLCHFLDEVSKREPINKMTVMNLATVFVHSIIRPRSNDPSLLMGTASDRTVVVFVLVTKWRHIFKMEYNNQGALVQVDNLLDLGEEHHVKKQFNPRTSYHVTARTGLTSSLFDIDFSSNLMAPLTPCVPEVAPDVEEVEEEEEEEEAENPVYDVPPSIHSVVQEFENLSTEDENIYDIPGPPRLSLTNNTQDKLGDSVNNIESCPSSPQFESLTESLNDTPRVAPPMLKPRQNRLSQPDMRPKVPPRPRKSRYSQNNGDIVASCTTTSSDVDSLVSPSDKFSVGSYMSSDNLSADNLSADNLSADNVSADNVSADLACMQDSGHSEQASLAGSHHSLDNVFSEQTQDKDVMNTEEAGSKSGSKSGSQHSLSSYLTDSKSLSSGRSSTASQDGEAPGQGPVLGIVLREKCDTPEAVDKHLSLCTGSNAVARRSRASFNNPNRLTPRPSNSSIVEGDMDPDDSNSTADNLDLQNLSNTSVDELVTKLTALNTELLSHKSEAKTLRTKLVTERDKHKQTRQSLAKQLEVERTATANAVDRIVKLQAQLQAYQLKYGPLDESSYGNTLFYG